MHKLSVVFVLVAAATGVFVPFSITMPLTYLLMSQNQNRVVSNSQTGGTPGFRRRP